MLLGDADDVMEHEVTLRVTEEVQTAPPPVGVQVAV